MKLFNYILEFNFIPRSRSLGMSPLLAIDYFKIDVANKNERYFIITLFRNDFIIGVKK